MCRKCEKEAKIVRAESDRLSVLSMQLDAKRKNLANEMLGPRRLFGLTHIHINSLLLLELVDLIIRVY